MTAVIEIARTPCSLSVSSLPSPGAAMATAAQRHQRMLEEQEEAGDVQHGPFPIEHLQFNFSFPWIKVVVKERRYILMLRVPLGPKDSFRLLTGFTVMLG
ncbi:hypothetical protein GW17_00022403 [Ensete ventricosum]|nr:hypothetical protein GW17_00022403 [Ensete ventricosum]